MRAFVVTEVDGSLYLGVEDREASASSSDDVLVTVEYSGVNFKDALVASVGGRVRRVASLIGGVDAAGVVAHSSNEEWPVGTRVAVHGGDLGVARDGGFASSLYTPARFLSALPDSVSTRDAMIVGTAGFTAMASVLALEHHGIDTSGEILVTGASGGVGSLSLTFLSVRGYRAVASTGSLEQSDWLIQRGATRVIERDQIADKPDRVLGTERWSGAIDCVGGETLHHILRSLQYGAAVAASGLVASAELHTNVYPFITRAVSLLGIDAVEARSHTRSAVWDAIGEVAPNIDFSALVDQAVSLEELPESLDKIRRSQTRGRILVEPNR
jgi:acrylyl-CoA reductase (NADPH)